ncbi:conserved hypothetical protein [Geotrichum candidum]|uniref:CHY-type domain-containing protein n=1 Tax=Geotrichum candidum TaxID=1173061 RepID=A0A0J9X533_GEOCN|nr:conserved hypothetical protein [Geotrichum candidum]
MCQHFTNAQVSIRTQCCRKWYDCPQCHEENEDHPLKKTFDITMICKKCRKAFRKDLSDFDETDQFCPNCDNEYVLPSVGVQQQIEQEHALQREQSLRDEIMDEHLKKLNTLDARMIREHDLDIHDEELLGFDPDYSTRLG